MYRLKSVVDSVVRDVERSKRGTIGTLAKTTAVPTRSNAVLTESHRSVGAFNTAKAARASADAKIFEDTIRAAEAKPNHLMEEAAVSRFRAEGERQDEGQEGGGFGVRDVAAPGDHDLLGCLFCAYYERDHPKAANLY